MKQMSDAINVALVLADDFIYGQYIHGPGRKPLQVLRLRYLSLEPLDGMSF